MDKTNDSTGQKKQDNESNNMREPPHSFLVPIEKSSSRIEFPQSQSLRSEFDSLKVEPHKVREEPEVEIRELEEWNDSIAKEIEELVLSNLQALFRNAIKQVVEFGCTEDVAEKIISRKGLYMAEGDPCSNIVNETLKILQGKQNPSPTDVVFESFQQMLNYTLVEIISVLRELRPTLTAGEAMWLLLICDFNISNALKMEKELDNMSGSVCMGESSASPSDPSHQNFMSEIPQFGSFENSPTGQCSLTPQSGEAEIKLSGHSGEGTQATVECSTVEGKSGTSGKQKK